MSRRLLMFFTLCFVVLNLSIPTSIAKGPLSGKIYAIEVDGTFAYMGAGEELVVFDVTNPIKPIQIASLGLLGDSVQDIQIVGDLAFIATGTAGLHIINVVDPYQPAKVSRLETPGQASGVYVVDGYAYLAAGSGLIILDVSDPEKPAPVAFSETLGWDSDVIVAKGYAYVASGEEGVRVVDVSNPHAPTIIGSIDTPNDANGIFAESDLLFIAAGSGGLQIVNISDPSNPKEVSVEDTGYARQVIVSSGYAYIASERKGLCTVDISSPTRPELIKRYPAEGSANSIDVEDGYIFTADGIGGLLVINGFMNHSSISDSQYSPAPDSVRSFTPKK